MQKNEFKPQIVYFKSDEFNNAIHQYSRREKAEAEINLFLQKVDESLFFKEGADPVELVIQYLEAPERNPMELSGAKIATLKGYSLEYLSELVKEFNKVKHLKIPNQNDYYVYTTNEFQNERLLQYKAFIKAYMTFIDQLPDATAWHNKWDFRKAFNRVIDWKGNNPSPKWEFLNH